MTLGLPTYVGSDIEALRAAARANLGFFASLPFFQRLLRASGFIAEADRAEEGAGGDAFSDRVLDAICLIRTGGALPRPDRRVSRGRARSANPLAGDRD